jgi:anti-sigma regulatory factor (Ser/Thr protein kinase)
MEISIDLRFPRDAASVPAVRRLLDSSLDVLGVAEQTRGDIRLMLTEACGNVIQHAGSPGAYTVRVLILDDRCVIKVIDHGRGFDPATITVTRTAATETGPARRRGQVPEQAEPEEHGRGFLIMESLADEVRLSSLPDQGALVSLEKRLQFDGDTLGRRLTGQGPQGDRVALMSETDPILENFASKLFDMARQGRTEQLIAYVEAGVPANLSNDDGDTLLMLAAVHGHADTVRALAAHGANPERENDHGRRPLAGAVLMKEPDVVRALLDAGADPRAGHPSAYETARAFSHTKFLTWFEEAAPSA